MKTNLPYKFTLICLLLCTLGFFLISTFVFHFHEEKILQEKCQELYKQAHYISGKYTASYEESASFMDKQKSFLSSLASVTGTRIILISPDGRVIYDSRQPMLAIGEAVVDDFDSGAFGSSYWKRGSFFDYITEDTLSVISPISSNFSIFAYVTIHVPVAQAIQNSYSVFNTNYATFAIMAAILILFLLLVIFMTHRPIKEIVRATEEYAHGNLNHVIKHLPNDEIGRMGASLNYMAYKLGEMDQFQKKFVSNISHDFRSPLTSIKGYLEAIEDGTIPPEMINKYIHIILFETERLTKLTNNLLTLNDMTPNSVHLDISSFDINNIIRHTLETFEGTCKSKKISFQLTFTSKQMIVSADMGKIQQVIYNLIDNAVKFSTPHSQIYISTTDKGERAFISVKDMGCGIPRESLGKIWDRFYKTDASRGRDKKGSGLGLAIVKEIIQAHNENIDVISTEGVGTEFIFTLPKAKGQER